MIGAAGSLHRRIVRIAAAALVATGLALAAHAEEGDEPTTEPVKPFKLPNTQFEPITWVSLEGWAQDDHAAALATFLTSCKAILKGDGSGRPMYEALYSVCERAVAAKPSNAAEARAFFEANFRRSASRRSVRPTVS
jgi:membrane-bound lytic murein transglycosylase A